MAGRQRMQRVQETLKETISEVIRKMKDPRLGFVTVTGVEVSPDLSYARVFVSAYGLNEEQKESLQALRHGSSFIRREVAHRVQLRHTPEIDFRLDETPARAERIMQILEEIKTDDPPTPGPIPALEGVDPPTIADEESPDSTPG